MGNVSSLRQALVLLSALPAPQLRAILNRLAPDEASWIKDHLARTLDFEPIELNSALRSFIQRSQAHPSPNSISLDSNPVSVDRHKTRPQQSVPAESTNNGPANTVSSLLQELPPARCLELLDGEDSTFVAAVLFLLPGKRCAELIERMALRERSRVLLDLANIAEIPSATIEHIRQKIQRKLEFGTSLNAHSEGIHRIRQLLEYLDPSVQGSIADTLAASNPALAAELHRNVFRFNDLLKMNRADIRKLLSFVDETIWAPALRYADERVRQHVLACMSTTAAKTVKQEMEGLADMPSEQSLARQQQILLIAQELFRKRIIARPKSVDPIQQAA